MEREKNKPVPEYRYAGRVTGDQLFLIKTMEEIEAERPDAEPPHRHDYYVLIWIQQARGRHYIDFSVFPIEPQSIFFIAPGQIHLMELDEAPQGIVMIFSPDFLHFTGLSQADLAAAGIFHDFELAPLRPDEEFLTAMRPVIGNMLRESNSRAPWRNEMNGAYLKAFLLSCQRLRQKQSSRQPAPGSRAHQIVCGFRELLEQKFRDKHKVTEYAQALHLTPNHLNEVIRENTGHTAKELIQERLLREAQRHALHTDCTLQEITFHLGFRDPAHFSKFFKKNSGMTFLEYRQNWRKIYTDPPGLEAPPGNHFQ